MMVGGGVAVRMGARGETAEQTAQAQRLMQAAAAAAVQEITTAKQTSPMHGQRKTLARES
jgi:hypothetical protein